MAQQDLPPISAHARRSPLSPLTPPLSQKLWDLDWAQLLPWSFEEVTVEVGTFDEALPFVAEHYARIFGTDELAGRFLVEAMTPAKRRFGAEMDVFLFRAEGRTVGIFMSHPSDWSTYYMRTAALLPEYRGRHLVSRFMMIDDDPALYLAYILFAEQLVVILGPEWLELLEARCGIPRSSMTVIGNHAELDKEHVESALEEIDDLVGDPRKLPRMRDALRRSIGFFDRFCVEVTGEEHDADRTDREAAKHVSAA